MYKVCVFLADGFEEIEGLTVVDLLRRAEIQVNMVSITKEKKIQGAHGIEIMADVLFEEQEYDDVDMLVLPGGMPGTLNLSEHKGLEEQLLRFAKEKRKISAICAAPSVLGNLKILEGKNATSYPGFEDKLTGAKVLEDTVVADDNIITSRGLGTAIDFSLALIESLKGREEAERIKSAIIY